MNILDLDFDKQFINVFTTSAGAVNECHCGREHVCINSDTFTDDEDDLEMIQSWEERNDTDDNLFLYYDCDYIEYITVDGKHYTEGCECEGWKPYMNFIINHRREIRDFLIDMAHEITIAAEQEKVLEILKEPGIDILDLPN